MKMWESLLWFLKKQKGLVCVAYLQFSSLEFTDFDFHNGFGRA